MSQNHLESQKAEQLKRKNAEKNFESQHSISKKYKHDRDFRQFKRNHYQHASCNSKYHTKALFLTCLFLTKVNSINVSDVQQPRVVPYKIGNQSVSSFSNKKETSKRFVLRTKLAYTTMKPLPAADIG